MRRAHLFEFHEPDCVPDVWRRIMTDVMAFFAVTFNVYRLLMSGMRSRLLILAFALLAGCTAFDHTPSSERARGFLEDTTFGWQTLESSSARIHYMEDTFAGRAPRTLAGRVEAAEATILRKLEIAEFRPTLDVFYVESRVDMERLTGFPVTGMSYAADRTVVVVFNENWRAFESHELTHVISRSVWGEPGPPEPLALEGLAVHVDGDCGGYPVGRVVRAMLDRGLLFALERLFASFRAEDDLVAYLQAGSLFDFFAESGGKERLRELWRAGLSAAVTSSGPGLAEFEGRWRAWLEAGWQPVPDPAWHRIREEGCGIDATELAEGP